jgi:tetratricopeptide (TPR) repeat protein
VGFNTRMVEIKWLLRLKEKEQYVQKCTEFITLATKFYGEFHPIFSELYDLFSAYHSSHSEHEDAITFAKSSLVNTLSLCGTQHPKTSECYYHLGLYYLKAGRLDEALLHFKKAKKVQEGNKSTQSVGYCSILLKMALVDLNQNMIEEGLDYAQQALGILEGLEGDSCEEELTECLETLQRCHEINRNKHKLRELSQFIGAKLKHVSSRVNLEKMLKIYMYPVLSDLTPQSASHYLDILSQLQPEPTEANYEVAFGLLRARVV